MTTTADPELTLWRDEPPTSQTGPSMKIRTNRKALADALTWTAQAISRRPVNPALGGIYLTTDADQLTLAAFDFDTSLASRIDVETVGEGECLVTGHLLREVVGGLKGETVDLEVDGDRLIVTSGRSTYRLATLRAEDYPRLPSLPPIVGMIASTDLARAVGIVEHAASRDEIQGVMTGVRVSSTADVLIFASTDRYRIARAEVSWSRSDADDFVLLPPAKPLVAAVKGLTGGVRVGVGEGVLGLADDRRTVTLRCMDLKDYPNVDRAFTVEASATTEVDTEDLADAVKRAVMAADEYGSLHLYFTEGEVEITGQTDSSDGAEYVEVDGDVAGQDVYITGRHVLAALAALGTKRVRLGFTGKPGQVKPIYINPTDQDGTSLLVMPRRQQ